MNYVPSQILLQMDTFEFNLHLGAYQTDYDSMLEPYKSCSFPGPFIIGSVLFKNSLIFIEYD